LKNILLLLLVSIVLFGKETQYMDEKKFDYSDFNFIVGVEGSWNYTNANVTIDKDNLGYGVYIGMPVYLNYDLLLKTKQYASNDFTINATGLVFNIPIDGSGARSYYIGLTGGTTTTKFSGGFQTKHSLTQENVDGNYFGVHFGKKWKFTRNFFVRFEMEYSKHSIEAKSSGTQNITLDNITEFNYGVEYRF
jgi:hypothetical protein